MKKTTIYRRPMCENLFDEALTIAALSAMGNPLEVLAARWAKAATALTCLVYNIFRYMQINKYQPQLIASMG